MLFRIDNMDIHPERSLVGKLRLQLRLRCGGQRLFLQGASGTLFVQAAGGPQVEVGELRMVGPDEGDEMRREQDTYCTMELFLNREMLHGIEEIRQGARMDVEAKIAFWGMRLDGTEGPAFRVTLSHRKRIERSQWIEDFLPTFEWDKIELWEVRTGPTPMHDELDAERNLIQRALQDYNAGDYEDAFRDCREALESLRNRQEELGIEELMGKQEWKRANRYLSIALHADNEIPGKVNRADAEFALTLTHAIYKRVAQSMIDPKPQPAVVEAETEQVAN